MYTKNPTTKQINSELSQKGDILLDDTIIVLSNTDVEGQFNHFDLDTIGDTLVVRGAGLNKGRIGAADRNSWWFTTEKADFVHMHKSDVLMIILEPMLTNDCLDKLAEVFNKYHTITADLFVHILAGISKETKTGIAVKFKTKDSQETFSYVLTYADIYETVAKYKHFTSCSGGLGEEVVHFTKLEMSTGKVMDLATLTRGLYQVGVLYYDIEIPIEDEYFDLESKDYILGHIKQIANTKQAVVHVTVKNPKSEKTFSDRLKMWNSTKEINLHCFCMYPNGWIIECKEAFFSTSAIKPIENALSDFDEVASFLLECKQEEKIAILIPISVPEATLKILEELKEVYNKDELSFILLYTNK